MFLLSLSGWESQLLETGFLGIFLCPLWTLSRLPRKTPTSRIVLWGFRWLIFRIMLGAVSRTFICNIWGKMYCLPANWAGPAGPLLPLSVMSSGILPSPGNSTGFSGPSSNHFLCTTTMARSVSHRLLGLQPLNASFSPAFPWSLECPKHFPSL